MYVALIETLLLAVRVGVAVLVLLLAYSLWWGVRNRHNPNAGPIPVNVILLWLIGLVIIGGVLIASLSLSNVMLP